MKQVLYVVSFFLLVLSQETVNGQTFYRQYGNNLVNEGGVCVVSSPDGNMFVGGYKDDSALVTKMDLSGNLIWVRAFKPVAGCPNTVYQLEITPDGFLCGFGNALVGGLYRDVFFFKINLAGTLQWMNRISDTRPIFGESIEPKTATEYLLVGDVYDLSSGSSADVVIFRINAANGSVISYSSRYDYVTSNSYIDDPYSSTLNPAGNRLYTTGRIYVNGAPATGMRPYLSKFDINGNHLSTSYLCWTAAQSARVYATDIVYNNDSLTMCYFGDVAGSSSNFTIGLIHTDTAGNIAWSRNFNVTGSGSEIASKVLVTPTGYMIVGYTIGGNNDFFIISTTANGTLLWAKSYGNAATVESFLVTTCPVAEIINGNIYMTGQSATGGTRNIVVAAIDMTGNIACMAPTTLAVTSSNNPTTKTPLTIGLVPVTLTFTFGSPLVSQPLSDVCSSTHLNLGNDTAVCTTYTINATLPGATAYLWSTGATTPTLSVNSSGTYWATVMINCCIYSDTIVISNGILPTAAFTAATVNCSGQVNFNNTSVNATSYSWNFGDATTGTVTNPSHTYASSGSYNVTLISTNNCGSDTMIVPITVNTIVDVTAVPQTTSICPGSNLNLSASMTGGVGPVTYSWNPGGAGQTITVNPVTTSSYVVTGTDSLGCSSIDTVLVNIIPVTTFSVSGAVSLCNGQSTTLNATSSSSGPFTWSNSPSTSSSATVSPTTTTTYYVSVTDSCSGNVLTDSVTVIVLPSPTSAFTFTGPDCFNNFSFTNQSTNSTSYAWNFGDNGTSLQQSPSHQYTTGGTYSVTLISSNSCGSDTSTITVIAPMALDVVSNPASVTVCIGDSVVLNGIVNGGAGTISYSWSPVVSTNSSTTVTPSGNTVYYISVTDSLGCTDLDSVVVSVSSPVTLTVAGNNTICAGTSTIISANSSNGGPYTWSNNLGSNDSVTVSPTVTTIYYVSVYDSCLGVTVTDSVVVNVNPPTTVAFSLDSLSGCAPLLVSLTDLSFTLQDQIIGWLWDFGDGDSSLLQNPTHLYTTPGTYNITLTVVTSSGCITTLINGATVTVYPVPVAGFIWDQTGGIGDQPEVQFTDNSTGGSTWEWLFGDSTTSSLPDPFHTYNSPGSYTATQIVGNGSGCYDTAYAQMELTGEFTIYVPNAFTPGVDYFNNYWGAVGSGIVDFHIMVFDRWGMLIFESHDFYQYWDGRFKGNLVQEDTYVWVIDAYDFRGEEHHLIGHVNVIR